MTSPRVVARTTGRALADEHVLLFGAYGVMAVSAGSSGGTYLVVMAAYGVSGVLLLRHRRHRETCYGRHATCRTR